MTSSKCRQIKFAGKMMAMVGAMALTGCAFVPTSVHPVYKPSANVQKIAGAENVDVSVQVLNEKKRKHEVQHIKNGYDQWLGPDVHMKVGREVKTALITALESKGFHVTNGDQILVKMVIHHWWSHEDQTWSKGIVQNGVTNETVEVIKNGNVVFHHVFEFNKTIASGQWYAGMSGFQNTIEREMLNQTIDEIVNDPDFIHALMGNQPVGVTVPKIG